MSRKILLPIAIGILCFCAVAVLYGFDPLTASFFPSCPVFQYTGFYCSGCGSLRALHRLFHGDLFGALGMNSLMVLFLPFLAFLVLKPEWAYKRWMPWACFAVLILYGILRNIPVWPFSLLAPHSL